MIARDQKLAHRSRHLRKQSHHGADSIDQLDLAGGPYHHEGPFDAASLARNRTYKNSPIEAVAGTNAEALRATPEEKIIDAVKKHKPLDGVAVVPPGQADREGRIYKYEEGTDLMIEDGGNYKRWPGVVCPPSPLHSLCPTLVLIKHNRNTTPRTSKAKASPPTPSRKP